MNGPNIAKAAGGVAGWLGGALASDPVGTVRKAQLARLPDAGTVAKLLDDLAAAVVKDAGVSPSEAVDIVGRSKEGLVLKALDEGRYDSARSEAWASRAVGAPGIREMDAPEPAKA